MNTRTIAVGTFWVAVALFAARMAVSADDGHLESIPRFLHENFDHKNDGMVVGIVDEHGSRVYSAGKLDNGT